MRILGGVKSVKSFLSNEKLGAFKDNKIVINKNMSETQLIAVESVTDKFLKHKYNSTLSGIKKTIKTVKKGIGRSFSVTEEEAETIFEYFDNDDFKELTNKYTEYDSALVSMIREAEANNWSQKTWLDRVKTMIDYTKDRGTRAKLIRIHRDLIKKG